MRAQASNLSAGETLIAIALAFALFFVGYIVRGWSYTNPLKDVALVVPTATAYTCTMQNGSGFAINMPLKDSTK